jgi:hypothetical protein
LTIIATPEVLVGLVVDVLVEKANRSVRESEIGAARMPGLEAFREIVVAVIPFRRNLTLLLSPSPGE